MGAKIVEFAGFLMPILYTGIVDEHIRVRTTVGIFDVSHMGEFRISGTGALRFLQKMCINDVNRLDNYQAQYSGMCYPGGGMVDDLLIYRFPHHLMMVVNAANTEKDFQWLLDHRPKDVMLENISDEVTLLAVQGKNSFHTLQKLTDIKLSELGYYRFTEGKLIGIDVVISRTGYTGEPGFEIYIPRDHSRSLWYAILEAGKEFHIQPVGLGARDTLRLEMRYCLYGNDIDETTLPVEAGLGWITRLNKGDFIGRDAIIEAKERGIKRKLIGFEIANRGIPRKRHEILHDGKPIGFVTSGNYSPMLKKPIGLGYVSAELAQEGVEFQIDIGRKVVNARVVKTPFYNPGPLNWS